MQTHAGRVTMHMPLWSHLETLTLIMAVAIGLFRFNILRFELRILEIFLLCSFAISAGTLYLLITHRNNLWLFHIHSLLEYTFLMFILARLQEHKRLRTILYISLPVFVGYWIAAQLTFETFERLDDVTAGINCVALGLTAFYTLFFGINRSRGSLFRLDLFWIVLGIAVQYSCTFALSALQNMTIQPGWKSIKWVWMINWIVSLVVNILYIIGLLCPPAKQD